MSRVIGKTGLLALIAASAVLVATLGWGDDPVQPPPEAERNSIASPPQGERLTAELAGDHTEVVRKFCTTCHVLPPPDCEPKDLWAAKIRQMYQYADIDRPAPMVDIPPIRVPIDYFKTRAPERLPVPEDAIGSPASPLAFSPHMIALDAIPSPPAISNVTFARLSGDAPTQLLISDMRHGLVVLWTPSRLDDPAKIIGRVSHPSHTHVVDFDGDGLRDVLVANLGAFWNTDTTEGSVVWLRGRGNDLFDSIVLLDGLNRVNDVQTADFDKDGDLDLVVGIFGNLTGGRIAYMENVTEDYSQPEFEPFSLDEHTGTSDVPVVDLNADGHLDFVALQSQESELVSAFLGSEGGNFQQETIYKAPHPRWGSTGIRLTDLDADGDVDVLLNHGDALESPLIIRPYHGLGWLENQGSFPFVYHRLAHLPGAHTSLPADLDGDGDLDVVSSCFMPLIDTTTPLAKSLETVVWLEQTSPGQYQRYVLQTGTPFHPCAALGDCDDDGDIDIVLGTFHMEPSANVRCDYAITVLENRLIDDDQRLLRASARASSP